MSSKLKVLMAAVALVVLIGAYFYSVVDWEARAVRQQMTRLVGLVEKDGPVSTLEALRRSRQLTDYFTQGAAIEYFPGRSLPKDLDAMRAGFLSVWGRVNSASIRVIGHEVEIHQSESMAESLLTAKCSVVLDGSEQMGDTMKYRVYWRKIEGDWRIDGMAAFESR